jgi:hypothetical protein
MKENEQTKSEMTIRMEYTAGGRVSRTVSTDGRIIYFDSYPLDSDRSPDRITRLMGFLNERWGAFRWCGPAPERTDEIKITVARRNDRTEREVTVNGKLAYQDMSARRFGRLLDVYTVIDEIDVLLREGKPDDHPVPRFKGTYRPDEATDPDTGEIRVID